MEDMSSNFSWVKKSEGINVDQVEQTISGIGIKKTEEIDASVLNDTIASINANNNQNFLNDNNIDEVKRQELIEAEQQKRRENYFKDKARKEKLAKLQREEEEQRLREAQQEKLHSLAERNPLFKFLELGSNAVRNITDNSDKTAFGKDNLKENKKDKIKDVATQLKNKELFKSREEKEDDEFLNSDTPQIISIKDEPVRIKHAKEKKPKEKKSSFFEELGKKFREKAGRQNKKDKNEDIKEEVTPEISSELPVATDNPDYSVPANEKDWQYLATHDDMTGLMNTRAFTERISGDTTNLGVAIIDIDGLNDVNNGIGHEYGDKFVRAVGNALEEVFNGCCYRIGGDEFAVILEGKADYQETRFSEGCAALNDRFKTLTDNGNPEGIIYSASFGYAVPHDGKSFHELQSEAEQMMQKDKEAYKLAHPTFIPKKEVPKPKQPENYDDLLTFEQRSLKNHVQSIHMPPVKKTTADIMRKIQAKASANEVVGVIMASPTFDYLAIFNDGNAFISMVQDEMQNEIDYSYLYVIYEGGPMCYGNDDYLNEVTHIFEGVADLLVKKNESFTNEEISAIPKINIFKRILISRE